MRALCEERLFDEFSLADRHRKDGPVKTAVWIPVLNRDDVELSSEEAQCRPTPVRRKPRDRAHSSPDDTLTIASGNNILYGSCGKIAVALGINEAEGPILHLQASFGVLLEARQTYDLHRLRFGRRRLGLPSETTVPSNNKRGSNVARSSFTTKSPPKSLKRPAICPTSSARTLGVLYRSTPSISDPGCDRGSLSNARA